MLQTTITGLTAGAVHVLAGPDHLAAVAPLAAHGSNHPWRSGLSWGLGHAGGVLLVGVAAILLREALPLESLSAWSEGIVGFVLIVIGIWGIRKATQQGVHTHVHVHDGTRHAHLHVHDKPAIEEASSGAARHAAGHVLNRLLAKRLMEKTRVYQLLRGYRNIPAANLELLEEILIRLAHLVTDFSEIQELDINPLVITANGFSAVDARILLNAPERPSPLHLVISPYPDQYEEHTTTNTGIGIFIRPIRPEDAPLLVDLFESLSPRSVYLRFFTPLKQLPHTMLARFTQIDYDRHIALVALVESESNEKMLGVARVISGRNLREAEFSVVVADPWQGKGIGAALLQRCLSIAQERGIQKITGTVLAENTQMLALGRKLGLNIRKEADIAEYELSIDFENN